MNTALVLYGSREHVAMWKPYHDLAWAAYRAEQERINRPPAPSGGERSKPDQGKEILLVFQA